MSWGELDGSPFAIEYIKRKKTIEILSKTQKVPGLDRDDVKAELEQTLWKAFQTFDPEVGTDLGKWWWVLWIRRKADLIEAFFVMKNPRPHEGALDDTDDAPMLAESFAPMIDLHDLCPSTDPKERVMWRMICDGFTGLEIRRKLRLSWRRYYAIVEAWNSDELRKALVQT